jgi:hypothetical protein
VPVGSHLAALPNKIGLNETEYFITQGIYNGWAWFGGPIIGAIVASAAIAFMSRTQLWPLVLATTSTLLMSATLVIFFIFTFPANQATANWRTAPQNWEYLRDEWEWSHAANAVLTFGAFCSLATLVLLTRENEPS